MHRLTVFEIGTFDANFGKFDAFLCKKVCSWQNISTTYSVDRHWRSGKSRGCFPKFANEKWPFSDHFWSFFCQLHVYILQNWGSDSHFEVLSWSATYLVQKLWQKWKTCKDAKNAWNEKTKTLHRLVFFTRSQKTEMEVFSFCVMTFEPIRI